MLRETWEVRGPLGLRRSCRPGWPACAVRVDLTQGRPRTARRKGSTGGSRATVTESAALQAGRHPLLEEGVIEPRLQGPLGVLSACLAGVGRAPGCPSAEGGHAPLGGGQARRSQLPCKYPRFTRFMTSLAVKFATSSTEHTGRGTDRNRERERSASSARAQQGRTASSGRPSTRAAAGTSAGHLEASRN